MQDEAIFKRQFTGEATKKGGQNGNNKMYEDKMHLCAQNSFLRNDMHKKQHLKARWTIFLKMRQKKKMQFVVQKLEDGLFFTQNSYQLVCTDGQRSYRH